MSEPSPSAQGFRADHSAGYTLQSVTLLLAVKSGGDATVALYSSSSGNPNISLATLTGPRPSGGTLKQYIYTCSSNCELTAGSSYFIVVTPATNNELYWGQSTSGTETNTPSTAAWSIADRAKFRNNSNWATEGAAKLMKVSWVTPGKVAGLTASAGNNSSIDLAWTAATSATGYKVQYKSGSQDWSSTRQLTSTTNSLNVTNSTVTANTAYTFRVAATNAVGDGAWSDEVVATPVEATLAASNVGADSATLTIANHTGTWYYKRTAPTGGTCSSGVATASTSVTGLSTGTSHTFSAYTDNQCTGTVLATTPQFLTKPGKAAGVTATAANAALDVSWTAETGASSYKVQWKSSSDSDWDATSRQTTSRKASATISSLTNGTTYTVRVTAVNAAGDGSWSDTATGTPSGSTLRLVTGAANGGVFAIADHSGTWYSKVTPPANATCETNASTGKTVTGKSSGSSYTLTAYSDSSCNTQLTSLDFTTLPAKVAGVTATARIGALDVGWTAESGSAPVSYKVQWKSGGEEWAAGREVVTTKAYTTLGLVNGTQYTIRVAATTAAGDGAWSDDATGTPSGTALTLTATPASNGAFFSLYNHAGSFYYKVTPPSNAHCIDGSTIAGTPRTFVDYTKSSGTEHNITVYSDTACSNKLASVDFITLPAKTTGVTLSNQGASLGVKWTAVTGAASYKVQWKSSADSDWDATNREIISGGTSAVLYPLTNGTAYSVRVAAVNASGDGAWSDTATATPSVTLSASNVTSTGATLKVAGHTGTAYLSGRGGNSQSLACTAASGGTHSPTLQGNITYEFKAYSNSSCTGTALATTSFTTPGAYKLFADNVTHDSVNLFIEGYGSSRAPYSYQMRTPGSSDSSVACEDPSRFNAHNPVTRLEPGTTYTAVFFWGAGCPALEKFADITFTTLALSEPELPKLSASNVTDTGATLAISNHTGDWWYVDRDIGLSSCTAVTGGATEVHLSGLTANTNYRFAAWGAAGCSGSGESTWSHRAQFTTTGPLSVSVGGKTSTGFTVNLHGYTAANGYPEQWGVKVYPAGSQNQWSSYSCDAYPRATTSAAVTGLKAGTRYIIEIYKRNDCYPRTNRINETPVTTVSLVSGSVGPSSATLTLGQHDGAWSYKGGETAGETSGAGAQATAQSDGASQCQAMTAGQATANVSGLKSETSYTYTAYDGSDCSGRQLGQTEFATPPPAVPGAPSGLAAAAGDASVTLTWNDPSDSTITGYEHQVNHNATDTGNLTGWGSWTAIDGSGAGTTSHVVSGLTNGREYRFRLRAKNEHGAGATAPVADPWYVSATPEVDTPAEAPQTPASVTVTRTDGALNVSWPAVEGATTYHITYTSDNGASWSLAAENHSEASITITGVDNALTYIAGVRARNQAGDSGWINSPPAGPYVAEPPDAVASVTVARGDGTLNASWPAAARATSYHVTYTSDNGASWSLAALNHPETSIAITGVDNGLTYIVGVRARNDYGDSGWVNSPAAAPYSGAVGSGEVPSGGVAGEGDLDGATGYGEREDADLAPSFGTARILDLVLDGNRPLNPLALPEATGGDGELTYALSPELPAGLHFDPATRVLSGQPTRPAQARTFEYTATDSDEREPDVATLTFSIEVLDLVPEFGVAHIPDLLLEANEEMEPLALPEATGGDGALSYALDAELPAGLRFDAATRVISGLPTQPALARSFEYTATDSDLVEPDVATLTFSIAVEVSAAERAVLNDALAAQGRAFLTSSTSAIGERFRAPADAPRRAPAADCPEERDDSDCTAPGRAATALNAFATMFASQAGATGPSEGRHSAFPSADRRFLRNDARLVRLTAHREGRMPSLQGGSLQRPDWNLGQMLQGRSFSMPLSSVDDLNGNGEGEAATEHRWTLWGAADTQAFNNPAEAGRFDGDVTSMFMGIDRRFGDGSWLAGAALSASGGETNYAASGREGRLETRLAGFHPYVWTEMSWGLEWWLIGGIGAGEATDLQGAMSDEPGAAGASATTANLTMNMAATGLRLPLRQQGSIEFALVGGAGMLTLRTDDSDRILHAVSGLETEVSQGRLGIEVSRTGTGLLPYLRLGARSDAGDGVTGTGMEAVTGVRYGSGWLDFEAQARWLGAHSKQEHDGYEEFGGMARLTVKAREDGSGLQLTVAPTWGQSGMGGGMLGGDGLLGGPGQGAMPMAGGLGHGAFAGLGAMSLETEFGYGFALERGLLTLGATHRRNGPTATETLGLTWKPGTLNAALTPDRTSNLRLGYELPTPTFKGGPYLELNYTRRF